MRAGTRSARWVPLLLVLAACAGQDAELQRREKAVASLHSTTVAVTDAWLRGEVSRPYARASLDRTFMLVEQERAAIAATPAHLVRPRASLVAREAEHLARTIAAIADDVRRRDVADAAARLNAFDTAPVVQP